MKPIALLCVAALALSADAVMKPFGPGGGPLGAAAPGMMGPPPFVQSIIASKGSPFAGGAGGPPMGMGMGGPPPFVQAKIASKGMMGGPPGMGGMGMGGMGMGMGGPPPFVQAKIASKGMFGGAAGAGAGFPYGSPPASSAETDPAAMGPPPFVQSLIAAKAGPFAAFAKPIGPPAWVQQLIDAKNAAAEAEAEALAAQSASAGAGYPTGADPASIASLPPFIQDMINAKAAAAGPFAPAVTTGAATKTAGPPPDWIAQLVQANMAAKAAKATPFGASPAGAFPPTSPMGMNKRDVSSQPSGPAPQPQPQPQVATFNPFMAPAFPQFQPAPQMPAGAPVPMMPMPMYPPPFVPYWKIMG